MMTITPRPYQVEAKNAVFAEFDRGIQSTLVEMPTGTGKTVFFAMVGHERPWGRVLVLAHRRELIDQAVEKIEMVTGDLPDIEMADEYAPNLATELFAASKYVVGSVQTVSKKKRLARFNWRDFGLVVIDEGHHAPASSYVAIMDYIRSENPDVKFLLVTATPDRGDGVKLGKVVDSVAYRLRIDQSVDDGYLVPPHQYFANIEGLDFSGLSTRDGDFRPDELSSLLRDDGGEVPHKIASAMVRSAGNEKAMIFTVDVAHARSVASIINRIVGRELAIAVDGTWEKDRRKMVLEAYRRDEFQYLVNCQLWTEGFDEPSVAVVGVARLTKSRALYTQMVGRGLRPLTGVVDSHVARVSAEARKKAISSSPKPRCLVVDLVGNSGRHKLVCTADILGSDYDPKVVERAVARAKKRKTPADMKQLLEEEKDRLARERQAAEERREARKSSLIGDVRMTMVEVDPFGRDAAPSAREEFTRQERMVSGSQLSFLEKLGIDATGWTFSEAQTLIGEHFARRAQGLTSIKVKRLLAKHGIDATRMKKADGRVWLDAVKAFGWRKPPALSSKDLGIAVRDDGFQLVATTDGKKVRIGPVMTTDKEVRDYARPLISNGGDAATSQAEV